MNKRQNALLDVWIGLSCCVLLGMFSAFCFVEGDRAWGGGFGALAGVGFGLFIKGLVLAYKYRNDPS